MVGIKPLEFVDDIADPNNGFTRQKEVMTSLQLCSRMKLSFAADKCKVLKIGPPRHTDHSVNKDEHKLDVVDEFRHLGYEAKKSLGTISELISLCKEVNFGKKKLTNMILLYHSVFVPRLIYNAEVWSNLTKSDLTCLMNAQLYS